MSDTDLALGRRLPWSLLVLVLLLPAALLLRDLARHRASKLTGVKVDDLGDFDIVLDFSLTERSGRNSPQAVETMRQLTSRRLHLAAVADLAKLGADPPHAAR